MARSLRLLGALVIVIESCAAVTPEVSDSDAFSKTGAHERPPWIEAAVEPRPAPTSDRGLLGRRAETLSYESRNAGRYSSGWNVILTGRRLVFANLSYAPTEDVQADFTGLASFTSSTLAAMLEARWVVARAARVSFAVQGRGLVVSPKGSHEEVALAGAGVLGEFYLDATRFFVLSAGVTLGYVGGSVALAQESMGDGAWILLELGASVSLGESPVRLLSEMWLPAVPVGGTFEVAPLLLIANGFRIHTELLSLDLGWLQVAGHVAGIPKSGFPWFAIGTRM